MVAIVASPAQVRALFCTFWERLMPLPRDVYCASTNVASLTPREAAAFRNREIGYVWQFHYYCRSLRPRRTWPCRFCQGVRQSEAMKIAANWLREVDLEDRGTHRPGSFLAASSNAWRWPGAGVQPASVPGDEPTGDLDGATAGRVLS